MKKLKCIIPALCATVLVGCVKKEETQVDTTPIVKLEKVSYFPVDQTYEYTGTIEAFNSNNIGPSMPLRIGEIQVEVGDFVKAGQPVVLMDKAQYIQQKAQRDNLQATYDRLKNLYETGGISKQDLDQAETALIVSKTAVQNLEENSTLRSPISGIVTARNYDRGDMSSALPILVIQQISPVKVVINVSEELFPKLKKGMDVALNLDIYPGETFPGKIHLIHPTVDARMHTFAVEVNIPNGAMKVRPGMFGRVTLSLGVIDRFVVPDRAVVKQAGSNERYVFVYNSINKTVDRKVVVLGRRIDTKYELLTNLDRNAQVVVAGHTQLVDGNKVNVQDTDKK